MAANYEKSVFYQLDLDDIAGEFAHYGLPAPELLPDDAPLMQRIHNRMLRARIEKLGGKDFKADEQGAFALLREGLLADMYAKKSRPHLNVYSDQIVWGRSPVRIDVAGGWTDTPPYSLFAGGNVVNMAIELNGQPPLQVYVKPCKELRIVLRSIDMGAMEVVSTFDELQDYRQVGSPFSIPKAALALAGFVPAFSEVTYSSLEKQLEAFGTGIEITLLSAIPAGSGLGTSSILASTVLGSLSDFAGWPGIRMKFVGVLWHWNSCLLPVEVGKISTVGYCKALSCCRPNWALFRIRWCVGYLTICLPILSSVPVIFFIIQVSPVQLKRFWLK